MTKGIARDQNVTSAKKELARTLRRDSTAAEQKFWTLVRGRKAKGRKFRRQQNIAGFVVDFYCPQLGLIVEIDGDIHAQRQEYDADRASILEGMGLRVVRFTNEQVLRETDAVFNRLDELTR